jgi:hypothetical protein
MYTTVGGGLSSLNLQIRKVRRCAPTPRLAVRRR